MDNKTEYIFLHMNQGNCITLYVERGTDMSVMVGEFRKIGFDLL